MAYPRGWINCPNYGQPVGRTFVPFKTPFKSFSPEKFIGEMRSKQIDIGLVINLCDTDRYYSATSFHELGIETLQICCRGRVVPDSNKCKLFVRACSAFEKKNTGKLIAVHCTHGFNRTGFMVCFYLCATKSWRYSPDSALKEFAIKRPPGIYRQHLITALYSLFTPSAAIMQAPPEPEWAGVDVHSSQNPKEDLIPEDEDLIPEDEDVVEIGQHGNGAV